MSRLVSAIASAMILLQPSLAAPCESGLCVEGQELRDETSLLQVDKTIKSAYERSEAPKPQEIKKVELQEKAKDEAKHEAEADPKVSLVESKTDSQAVDSAEADTEEGDGKPKKHAKAKKNSKPMYGTPIQVPIQQLGAILQPQQSAVNLGSAGVTATQQQAPTAAQAQALGFTQPWGVNANVYQAPFVSGYSQGFIPSNAADYHQNTMTFQSLVSNGGGNDDPKRAAARAAQAEELAERAMEAAVWKAQQNDRASTFASKRAESLRQAAEKASDAETNAARLQIEAADARESHAVRSASTGRTHARLAAYKAVVQQATAYQAAADQTFASQRAVAARSTLEMARDGLHSMQDDTEAADNQYDDRDSSRATDYRYHNAMDNVNADRQRSGDEAEDEDYDEGDYGGSSGGSGGSCSGFSCPAPQVSRRKSCGSSGCSVSTCCSLANCRGFACQAPTSLLPNPGSLTCGIEGCTSYRCCSAAAGVAASTGGGGACQVGDLVDATFSGDGRQYRAKVAANNADGTISLNWLDGYTEGNVVSASAVYNNGQPCSSR